MYILSCPKINILKFKIYAIVLNFMISSLAFVFSLQVAHADLTVGDLTKDVIHTADRGITPTDDLNVFDGESGSYKTDLINFGRYMKWLCLSSSSPVSGACETAQTPNPAIPSVVQLEFTELRSNVKATVNLHGSKRQYSSFNGLYCGGKVRMNWGHTHLCETNPDAVKLFLFIPRTEIAKLPFGGIWQATLKLRTGGLYEAYHGTWTANITLHVSDNNNISIYFPQFDSATSQVDLKLHTIPTPATPGGEMRGQANLDMCLYDGFNAQSSRYQVTLTDDQSVSGRPGGAFSVFRDNQPSTDARRRVDYHASLRYNGRDIALPNNEVVTLEGINQAEVRPVRLPAIPQPVYCTPAPLSLLTPAFSHISKENGSYGGRLRVIFTPSLE
ncbi:CfaE/CblD family pilus tip adhesin [Duffyella gerundensis]|uniref:CfaE/CblD family pilus tip adhesin n=1 Tax=Duffyella TaxID=3026546 RepID=UPI003F6DC7EA